MAESVRAVDQSAHPVPLRSGAVATLEAATPWDTAALRVYFAGLSARSRYNRFAGARGALSDHDVEAWTRTGGGNRFAVVVRLPGETRIVGEALSAYDRDSGAVEFGLSVHEAARGQGIGCALIADIARTASLLGAQCIFGDILRSNDDMQALARKAGFAFAPTPGDWHEVRVIKAVTGAGDDLASDGPWRRGLHKPRLFVPGRA